MRLVDSGRDLAPRNITRTHECSVCAGAGPWTEQWVWYGSYRDLEDGKSIVKICSEKCRKIAEQVKLVPTDAPDLEKSA